jgi:4-hydroxy-tetrahydrodipicolinate synthase
MMAVGAVGVVSVISHLAGPAVKAMLEAVSAGDYDEARRLHNELVPLQQACFGEPSPAPVKGALSRLWEPVGEVRLPLVPASEDTLTAIEKALGAISTS